MKTKTKNLPALYTVMWPTGPVRVCARHMRELVGLAQYLGHYVPFVRGNNLGVCQNCINERAQGNK